MWNILRRSFTQAITACLLAAAFFFQASAPALAINYAGGTYTNLCGSGYSANSHSCNGGCNTGSGSCSAGGNFVVKFVCDGRQGECRSNESSFSTSQSVSGVGCGKTVQIDVFNKTCRMSNGSWTCGDGDLKDYIVWYSGDCSNNNPPPSNPQPKPDPTPTPPADSCSNWMPIDVQFRKSGETSWTTGSQLTRQELKVNDKVDAYCFAKNATASLKDANMEIRKPDGTTEKVSGARVNGYTIAQNGAYVFTCTSSSLRLCYDSDMFSVHDNQVSSCSELSVLSGNDQTVPATVKFRAAGRDNKGDIKQYRFFFGDGQRVETSQAEVEHRYETSGNFWAKVEVKDTNGTWKTSTACEASVRLKSSSIESHRSGCSDVFILEGNNAEAPTTTKFRITGFDNKGGVQQFRLDFGNGIVKEQSGEYFEQTFDQAGTYSIKGYVKDSQGNWKGGEGSCAPTLYVKTKPLTTQPKTGTPTNISIFAITSGFIGTVMLMRHLRVAKKHTR